MTGAMAQQPELVIEQREWQIRGGSSLQKPPFLSVSAILRATQFPIYLPLSFFFVVVVFSNAQNRKAREIRPQCMITSTKQQCFALRVSVASRRAGLFQCAQDLFGKQARWAIGVQQSDGLQCRSRGL